jgi:hypothetical protein
MTRLSAARLRNLARARDLKLAEEEIERLRPMVEDLLNIAERIRKRASEWAPDQQSLDQHKVR